MDVTWNASSMDFLLVDRVDIGIIVPTGRIG